MVCGTFPLFLLVKMLFKYKKIEGLWCFVTTKQMIQLDFCHSFLHAFAYCDKSFLETTLAPWCTGDYLCNINNAPVFCSDKHIYIMMLLLIMHTSVNTFQYDWFCYQHMFFFQLLVTCACGWGVMVGRSDFSQCVLYTCMCESWLILGLCYCEVAVNVDLQRRTALLATVFKAV